MGRRKASEIPSDEPKEEDFDDLKPGYEDLEAEEPEDFDNEEA